MIVIIQNDFLQYNGENLFIRTGSQKNCCFLCENVVMIHPKRLVSPEYRSIRMKSHLARNGGHFFSEVMDCY